MQRFLRSLKIKAFEKLERFPHPPLVRENIKKAKNFYGFDNLVTAPIHGFKDANDYWKKSSSKQFITSIKTPTLLITSYDDPFLSKTCIPIDEAKNHTYFTLEATKYGGHVGFNTSFQINGDLWLENRVVEFLQNQE